MVAVEEIFSDKRELKAVIKRAFSIIHRWSIQKFREMLVQVTNAKINPPFDPKRWIELWAEQVDKEMVIAESTY